MRTAIAAAALALVAAPGSAEETKSVDVPGFWTPEELRGIDEGLAVLNVTRADLGFQKRPIDDPFRLRVVNRILDEPLAIGEVAAEWDDAARTANVMSLLDMAGVQVGASWFPALSSSGRPDEARVAVEVGAGATVDLTVLVADIRLAQGCVTDSLRRLEGRLRPVLKKSLGTQVEKPAVPIDADDLPDADFLAQVPLVDRSLLTRAGFALAPDLDRFVAQVRSLDSSWKGVTRVSTQAGDVVVYGAGDDVHGPDDDSAVLVIDLGGNDTYTRGASANLLDGRAVSVVIDLAGDDLYVGGNDFSFGGALGGVAIQWDCAGNDTYVGGNVSCGAGILGVGVLVDEGGNDTYRVKDFGQGAGAFGIGLLLEKGGNDFFHADLFGQGFASTWGCGMLVEMSGNDVYDAGGAHLHAPLWRDRFQSLSQGFSIGMRPDASGGVGVLVDVSGNDRYSADIYGQGASYWYALGLLIDDDGHDTYALGQYGQGSGIHLSAGMLLDRAGQDSYYDANGVGMGGAHDFSVGFLVDRGGDDYYAGGGGAQGGALTNSVAMLIDSAGDDGYCAVRGGTQGSATAARNTGGIGLLVDIAGKDHYSETTRNDGVAVQDVVGVLLDQPTPEDKPSANAMAAAISPADAASRVEKEGRGESGWDLDKLWKLVTQWEVGDNTVVMPIARERFFALGRPALDRAFEHLGTKDGLVVRAIEQTLRHFAKSERPLVLQRLDQALHSDDAQARRNALAMLAPLEAKEALPRLVALLATEKQHPGAVLAALAAMKTAPPEVAAMLRHEKEGVAVQAAVCLGAAGGDGIADLADALGPDFAFAVRLAAQERLAAIGAEAVPLLAHVASDAERPVMTRRNALRTLGMSKAVGACAPIASALADDDRFVRLSAMLAATELTKSLKPAASQWLRAALTRARERETDPLVRRLVERTPL